MQIEKNHINLSRNVFDVRQIGLRNRFNYNEYVYEVNIGADNMSTLPDFLNNLNQIFNYLINVMKYNASSGNNKARFYISKAPRTPFSTAILNVSDFNMEMFFNIFERHMQSNAEEIINNGWSSTVSLYIFRNTYMPQLRKKRKTETKSFLYKKFSKNGSEAGSGRKTVAKKKGDRYGTVFFKFRYILKIVALLLHYWLVALFYKKTHTTIS